MWVLFFFFFNLNKELEMMSFYKMPFPLSCLSSLPPPNPRGKSI